MEYRWTGLHLDSISWPVYGLIVRALQMDIVSQLKTLAGTEGLHEQQSRSAGVPAAVVSSNQTEGLGVAEHRLRTSMLRRLGGSSRRGSEVPTF